MASVRMIMTWRITSSDLRKLRNDDFGTAAGALSPAGTEPPATAGRDSSAMATASKKSKEKRRQG